MSLKEFINVKNDKNINLLVLSEICKKNESGMYQTASKFVNEAKKRGINCYPILVDNGIYISSVDMNKSNIIIRNYYNNNIIDLDPKNTVALIRKFAIRTEAGRALLSYLKSKGVFLVNTLKSMDICNNKYTTAITLQSKNIPIPKTILVSRNDNLQKCLKEIGNTFPIIIKLIHGSGGKGVCKVDQQDSFSGIIQALLKNNDQVLVQEFLNSDYDVRTIVINGEIFGAMKRNKIPEDFRSNYSLGGTVQKYNLSSIEKEIVLNAAKATGCYFCGVDHMVIDNKPYVLEVNSSPGSEGIEKATNKSLINSVLDSILDKTNWIKSSNKLTIGWLEYMIIPEIEMKLKAKADTGNGAYNVIDADNIVFNNSDYTVSFSINGKKLVKDVVDILKISIGGHKNQVAERPLIKLDIMWNNQLYKDVLFTLDKRKAPRQPILLCRNFLRQIGVSVDPNSKFTLGEMDFSTFKRMFLK